MKVSDLVESIQMLSEISREHAEEIAWELRHEDEQIRRESSARRSFGGYSKNIPSQPKPDVKPELTHWVVFSNITDDKAAMGSGLKQFASGPRKGSWWFGLYNTSGKTAETKLKAIEEKFGKGTKVAVPKK